MMYKKILLILILLFLNNCAVSGSAFLGPMYTGAKTGSIYQASLSYGSGKIMNFARDSLENTKNKLNDTINELKEMPILLSLVTHDVNISSIEEEEPLP